MKEFQIVYVNPNDLIDYENNNKIHTEEDVQLLASLLDEVGMDVPVVIDENNVLIKGHLRKLAEIYRGTPKIAAIIRDDMTDEQKRLARIADNKFSERSQWDHTALRTELNVLKEMGIDLSLTGFNKFELEVMTDLNKDFSFNSNFDDDDEKTKSGIEGTKDGRSFLCEISFRDKNSAEEFLKSIGVKNYKFKGHTKLVDGEKEIDLPEVD